MPQDTPGTIASNLEMTDVVAFEIVCDFTLTIEFADQSTQTINFRPILSGPLFADLRDLTLFNQVKLDPEIGTLVWPNGADIAPEVLHGWPQHVPAIVARRTRQPNASTMP